METLEPKGEKIRRAVRWLCGEMVKNGEAMAREKKIEAASVMFNLSPIEEEFLRRYFTESNASHL